jgi:hypothetical protein
VPDNDNEADFAERVLALYRAALAGNADRHTEQDIEVRSVAFGLTALKQAIDDRKFKYQRDRMRLMESGVYQALDIIEALTTGQGHPLWRFVAGMRSGRFRPGRAPAIQSEMDRRTTFAAIAWAYKTASGGSEREAAAAVAEGIGWEDHRYSPAQIRQWMKRLQSECEPLRQKILGDADRMLPFDPLPARVLTVGRSEIYHSSATVPAAAR